MSDYTTRHHKLHEKLKSICPNVYFQVDISTKLKYPCFKYVLKNFVPIKATNRVYITRDTYTVTYITKTIDDNVQYDILYQFDRIAMDNMYVVDGLYHFVYTIIY